MALLNTLETRLGSMDGWPSQILCRLFVEEPTFGNVESVTAFFYGNGAPCGLCSQAFHGCNAAATLHHTQDMYMLYDLWRGSPFGHRMAVYYDLQSKMYLYINGRRRDRFEVAPVPRGGYRWGIAATGHAAAIHERLQFIRDRGFEYL